MVEKNGNVGIGLSNPNSQLEVSGYFELDKSETPSQWYITDNWMVTHNSTLSYKISSRVKSKLNYTNYYFNKIK